MSRWEKVVPAAPEREWPGAGRAGPIDDLEGVSFSWTM